MPPTKQCPYFAQGKCQYGARCKFSHDISGPTSPSTTSSGSSPNRKTGTICPFYNRPRGCNRGSACNFLHPSSSGSAATPSQRADIPTMRAQNGVQNIRTWKYMIPLPTTTNKGPLGPRLPQFFRQAFEMVSARNANDTHEIITSLATEGGALRIKEVAEVRLDDLPDTFKRRRFEDLFLPFLKIITHEDVLSSLLLENAVGTIYNILFGQHGTLAIHLFNSIADVLFEMKFGEDAEDDKTQELLTDSISATLQALAKCIDVNQTAFINDSFTDIVEKISNCIGERHIAGMGDLGMQVGFRSLERIRARMGLGSLLKTATNGLGGENGKKPAFVAPEFEFRREMPGRLSLDGPRHDNDHEDISNIKIMPTAEEIRSGREEYLPELDPQKLHLPGMDGLLDRHFRLLREDTVGQLRDAVRLAIGRLQKAADGLSVARKAQQGARVFEYHEVRLTDLKFEIRTGLQVLAEFDQPHAAAGLSTSKQRAMYWSESKQMQVDALLCLVDSAGKAMFFSVCQRDSDYKSTEAPSQNGVEPFATTLWNNSKRAAVLIQPVDCGENDICELFRRFDGKDHVRQVLVEFPGVLLPSFRPTLQALQTMSKQLTPVPFAELLAPRDQDNNRGRLDILPPAYALQRGFQFSLSSVTGGVQLTLAPNVPFDMERLREHSTLDEAQCQAFVHALRSSMAVIQGPPGTGKSYVGTKIVKTLLDNRRQAMLGPIICVCYTNHALDQILEHLIHDGVDQVIRLGSRSKSEILAPLNLIEVSRSMERTKAEKHQDWMWKHKLEDDSVEVNQLLAALKTAEGELTIKEYLEAHHPHHYNALFGDADDEGWTRVRSGKYDAIRDWLHGWGGSVPTTHRIRRVETLLHCALSSMSIEERRLLYEFWIGDLTRDLEDNFVSACAEYAGTKANLERCRKETNLRCLREAHVIGVTTTGLARNLELLRRLPSKVLLCEEAGEILEAHNLTALLPSIEHCILIGDHEQLRPQIQNYDFSLENHRGEKYSLNLSMFERLIRPLRPSVQVPYSSLQIQRRMHPSIATLIRDTLYSSLQDHNSVNRYPEVTGLACRLYWLDHRVKESGADGSHQISKSNDYEVEMTAALVSHLVRQGVYKSGEIAVITPYLLQLRKIRKRLSSAFEIVVGDRDIEDMEKEGLDDTDSDPTTPPAAPGLRKTTLLNALRVATVDNFQGEEADIIVVSLVRCNDQNRCGFLKTSNRINVLLSRARHGMYIIGNAETSRHVPMWDKVITILERNGNIGSALPLRCPRHPDAQLEVSTPDDFPRLAPEGGCSLACDWRLACGHACINKCHSKPLHSGVVCQEPCPRSLPGCDHSCPRHCGEECVKSCRVIMKDVMLPCHHIAKRVECHQAQKIDSYLCRQKVQRIVPVCGHTVLVDCHKDVTATNFQCLAPCGDILPCGHECRRICHSRKVREGGEVKTNDHGKCTTPCKRAFSTCTHVCPQPCHDGSACAPCDKSCETRCEHSRCSKKCSEPCQPCAEACSWSCEHHAKCEMPCAVPCDRLPCSVRCQKTLACGHQCPSICGESCPPQKFCQVCGTDNVKEAIVDYIMNSTYAETDLEESPVIIPSCGHLMTLESFDGHMGMTDHYEISETGAIVGAKTNSRPIQSDGLKRCPLCRGPFGSIERYKRIVKHEALVGATRKFMIWANASFLPLENRLHEQEQRLRGTQFRAELLSTTNQLRVNAQDVMLGSTSEHTIKPLVIKGRRNNQIQTIRSLPGLSSRYKAILALRTEITNFFFTVSESEQPFGRVHQLVQDVRRRHGVTSSNFNVGTNVGTRNRLLATVLALHCDLTILTDFIKLQGELQGRDSPTAGIQEWMTRKVKLDLSSNRTDSLNLITLAERTGQPMQEIEGRIFYARFVALERSSMAADDNTDAMKELLIKSKAQLTAARAVCGSHPSTGCMLVEIEDVEKMLREETFYSTVSNEERHEVYKAMAREFRGTGHWYYCENGHPFTIGECGMAMQESRCPECGAVVGGRNHQSAQGVQAAADLERQFGRMAI